MQKCYNRMLYGYVGFVSIFLLYVGIAAMRLRDRWAMGDWYINYTGGFVRRGLLGQIVRQLSGGPPYISIDAWVLLIQLMCYAVMFGTVVYLTRKLPWSFWLMLLLYSPATLSFTLFEPTFAFRKEILFLALLSLLAIGQDTGVTSSSTMSILLVPAVIIVVLSHEALLLYYPYLVAAMIIGTESVRRGLFLAIPSFVTGVGAFILCIRHPGTLQNALAICSSLGESTLAAEPCSGAIVYMTRGPDLAHQDVLVSIAYWHFAIVMPFLFCMAMFPLVVSACALWNKQRQSNGLLLSAIACSCVAWLATMPLFAYAFDWNRWIYIHVFSSMILLLLIARKRDGDSSGKHEIIFRGNAKYAMICVLTISSLGWQLGVYHHFPMPGETLILYMRKRMNNEPLHSHLNWRPPGT